MNKLILLTLAVLLVGCTQKYAIVTVYEGGTLTVHGNVDPQFLREGTTETMSPSVQLEANMNKGEVENCNSCHAAYAGELFSGKLQEILKDIEKDKGDPVPTPPEAPIPEPPIIVEPDPEPEPPKPAVHTDTLKIHDSRNAPYWQYYAYKPISKYPKRITVTAGNHSWVINLTGRTRPGYIGKPGADHSPYFGQGDYIIKESTVGGRGLTVLIHEKFGRHPKITVSY